jgi:hypothetical protein
MKYIVEFEQNILQVGEVSLRAHNPEFVETYHRVLAETTEDVDAAQAAVRAIATPRFASWRKIIECLLEIHLSVAQLETALRAFDTRPSDQLLQQIGISLGQWVAMNHNNTYVTLDGLIERAQSLGAASKRPLHVPDPIMGQLKARTDRLHAQIGEMRDPIVHGGLVKRIREERLPELCTLLGELPSARDILGTFAVSHRAWSDVAHGLAVLATTEIDAVIGELNAAVDWDTVRRAASR